MSGPPKSHVDEEDLDDLDDLDDVLDQFSPPPPQSAAASTSTSPQQAAGPSKPPIDDLGEQLGDGFAEEMESFIKALGIAPRTDPEDPDAMVAKREQLMAAWEAALVEGMDTMSGQSSAAQASTDPSSSRMKDNFQSSIRSAMDRRKETESDLNSSAGDGSETFESLLSTLKELGDLPDGGEEDDQQLQGVLEAMMGQLMSKDVLYEPLKELQDKFPGYLAEHSSTISPEDKKRFEAQISCIKQLVDEFEADTYRDDNAKAHERIVALMSELQTHGSPPEKIMGPLPPGFNMGADGLPELPENCTIS